MTQIQAQSQKRSPRLLLRVRPIQRSASSTTGAPSRARLESYFRFFLRLISMSLFTGFSLRDADAISRAASSFSV